jgi:hypothetical protein
MSNPNNVQIVDETYERMKKSANRIATVLGIQSPNLHDYKIEDYERQLNAVSGHQTSSGH